MENLGCLIRHVLKNLAPREDLGAGIERGATK